MKMTISSEKRTRSDAMTVTVSCIAASWRWSLMEEVNYCLRGGAKGKDYGRDFGTAPWQAMLSAVRIMSGLQREDWSRRSDYRRTVLSIYSSFSITSGTGT